MADRNGYIGRAPGDSAVQVARQDFTPTGVQTNFTFDAGYTPGYLDVYLNGSKLVVAQDFTATDGSVVGLTSAAASGDIIELVAFKAFNAASVNNAGTLTVSGNQTNNGTLSVTGGTTLSNLNVSGISTLGTVSGLDLNGSVLTLDADGDTTITADTDDQIDIAFGGNDRITLSTGLIDLKNDGSQSAIRLYCESSNAHYAALQAPAHSAFSGNITLTLPATTDTLVARTTTDTLTNKTLTSPTISTPTLTGGVGIADSIFHTGDTNTQLRFPAADTFTVETAGSEAFRIDSSQRLLIGETTAVLDSSNALLQIGASAGANMVLYRDDSSVTTDDSLGLIRFYSNAGSSKQEHARITATAGAASGADDKPGNLLFYTTADGASSVTERLRIDSTGIIQVKGDGGNNNKIYGYDGSDLAWIVGNNNSDDTELNNFRSGNLLLKTNGAERVRIDSAGDMGLGVTPNNVGSQRTLHIKGPSGEGAAIRLQDNGDTADSDDYWIYKNSSAAYLRVNGTDPLRFYLNGAERAVINSSGNFLVGHDSAADSNDRIEISNTFGGRMGFLRNDTSTAAGNNIGMLSFYGNDSNGTYQETARISAEADLDHATDDKPGRLLFYTTADGASSVGTERVRIDSKGVITAKNGAVAEIDTLTSASTVTPDFAASCNFTLTLGTDVTLANPSNLTAGQSGSIFLIQDGTGSRTITFGNQYDFAGGTAPTLSTAASSVDRLDYFVRTSSSIHCVVTLAYS